MSDMIQIDGSEGEGGGQILRSALAMSLISGRPFSMIKIRAGRDKPGLKPQHMAAIEAAAQISGSQIEGAVPDSMDLTFLPGAVRPGNYCFKVPTAGAMSLVLQTVALPLALTDSPSHIEFRGGTHVPWAPIYDYLELVWAKTMQTLGWELSLSIQRAGYYPKGNGLFSAKIFPAQKLSPLHAIERLTMRGLRIIGVLSNLPAHIVEREFTTLKYQMRHQALPPMETEVRNYPCCQSGNALFIVADFGVVCAGFSALGEKGKSAEQVASGLAKEFCNFLNRAASVEQYLADQILLPLSFASGTSRYRVDTVTQHLLTNAAVIQKFSGVKIRVVGNEGETGEVEVVP